MPSFLGLTNEVKMQTLDLVHPSRSENYKLIKTSEIVNNLESQGFKLVDFKATKTKREDKKGYQKHFAILEHPELLKGDNSLNYQLLITNSHDGSTSFKVDFGVFRMVCSNGLVVGSTFGGMSQRHSGFIMDEFQADLNQFVARLPQLKETIDLMNQKKLNDDMRRQFYKDALKLKVDNAILLDVPTRRNADNGSDLFTAFNVIQEHLVRGGLTYQVEIEKDNQKQLVEKRLRALRSMNSQVEINKKLFDLANNYLVA